MFRTPLFLDFNFAFFLVDVIIDFVFGFANVDVFIAFHLVVSCRFKTRARVVQVDDEGGIVAFDVTPRTLKIYPRNSQRKGNVVYLFLFSGGAPCAGRVRRRCS